MEKIKEICRGRTSCLIEDTKDYSELSTLLELVQLDFNTLVKNNVNKIGQLIVDVRSYDPKTYKKMKTQYNSRI
jgi:hypothetical protein